MAAGNDDGSYDLYFAPEEKEGNWLQTIPGKNWLPAPADGFRFTARIYGPYAPLVDGTYDMPKVEIVR